MATEDNKDTAAVTPDAAAPVADTSAFTAAPADTAAPSTTVATAAPATTTPAPAVVSATPAVDPVTPATTQPPVATATPVVASAGPAAPAPVVALVAAPVAPVKPVVAASPAPVVAAAVAAVTPAPVQTPAPAVASVIPAAAKDLETILSPKTYSAVATASLQALESYAQDMRAGILVQDQIGGKYQKFLLTALSNVISKTTHDEFEEVFGKVLKMFEEDKTGCFGEMYVFRFMAHTPMEEKQREAFANLVNLLKLLAPVQGRELALKQVNLNHALALEVSELGRSRVMEYFK